MRSVIAICALAVLAMVATPTDAWNAGANGTAAMSAHLFNKVFKDVIPLVEAVAPTIEIPGRNGKHYSIGAFHVESLTISSLTVAFIAPNKLQLSMSDLSVSLPHTGFSVFTHIFEGKEVGPELGPDFKISCSGDAWGGISGASALINVDLSVGSDGKIQATTETPSLTIGTLTVDYKMHSIICKVGGDIIHLFLGLFKKLIEKRLNKALPRKIESVLQGIFAKDLPKIPLHFASQPSVVDDTLQLDVELIPPFLAQKGGSRVRPMGPAVVQPHIFVDRDVSVGINTLSFNDIIASAAMLKGFNFHKTYSGKVNTSIFEVLIPSAYTKCPDCPFALDFDIPARSPPTVIFGGEALTFNFNNARLNFTAVGNGDEENLFSVYTNLSFAVANFTVTDSGTETLIKFDLDLISFTMALGYSFIGPIDVSKFATFAQNVVKNIIDPLFNEGFKGIPLNLVKDGFGLDSWKVDLKQDAISLGANLVLPPSQAQLVGALMRLNAKKP